MEPFSGLSLTHAKNIALHFLDRINLEIEQDKEQLILQVWQHAVSPSATLAQPFSGPFFVAFVQIGFIRSLKSWQ